jgi:p-hydroxybenzoate 3-monooxygenase
VKQERTQVGIIGAGPAGLMLSHLLARAGIDSVIVERRSREYIEKRVRAGVLEEGTVQLMRDTGLGERMDREGLVHRGISLRFEGHDHRIAFDELTGGSTITVYGQQEVVKDLIAARLADGADLRFEASDVEVHDIETARPSVTFMHDDNPLRLDCDFVVGADGFHGICRNLVSGLRVAERKYSYSWLGILAEAPPSSDELIYCRHPRGFALHSMRSKTISRMYLQVPADERLDDWSDERIWAELHTRLATDDDSFTLTEGPLLDKGITPMRSFVSTPMQAGRLFLAGDAAHIVPPTGAKGMNLAIADVRLLARAFAAFYTDKRTDLLDEYTTTAALRIWRATHFSWWMTTMLHVDAAGTEFDDQLALSQLEYVAGSRAMATSLAENYTGLPYQAGWSYK